MWKETSVSRKPHEECIHNYCLLWVVIVIVFPLASFSPPPLPRLSMASGSIGRDMQVVDIDKGIILIHTTRSAAKIKKY